jgi:hypothetical protein
MSRYLTDLGYKPLFQREVTIWGFKYGKSLQIQVLEIPEFGAMIEISVPPTKVEVQRKMDEQAALTIFEKFGVKKQDITPVDSITLQYYIMQQMAQQQAAAQQAAQPKGGEDLSPEDLELLKKLLSQMPQDEEKK